MPLTILDHFYLNCEVRGGLKNHFKRNTNYNFLLFSFLITFILISREIDRGKVNGFEVLGREVGTVTLILMFCSGLGVVLITIILELLNRGTRAVRLSKWN